MADQKTYTTTDGRAYTRALTYTKTRMVGGQAKDVDDDLTISLTPVYTTRDAAVQQAIEDLPEFGTRIVELGEGAQRVVLGATATTVAGGGLVGYTTGTSAPPPAEPTPTDLFKADDSGSVIVTDDNAGIVNAAAAPMNGSTEEVALTLVRDYGFDPAGLRDGAGWSDAAVAGAAQGLGLDVGQAGTQRVHPASPPPNVMPRPSEVGTLASPEGHVVAPTVAATPDVPVELPTAAGVVDSDGTPHTAGRTGETGTTGEAEARKRAPRAKKG